MKKININEVQQIEIEMIRVVNKIFQKNNIVYYMSCGSCLGAIRHNGPIPWDADMDIIIPINLFDKAINCLENELPNQFRIHDYNHDKNYYHVFPRMALKNTNSDFLHIDIFPLIGMPDDEDEQIKYCKKIKKVGRTICNRFFRKYIAYPNFIKNCIGKFIEITCSPLSTKKLFARYDNLIRKYDYCNAKYVAENPLPYGIRSIIYKSIFDTPKYVEYDKIKVPVPQNYDYYLTTYYEKYLEYPSQKEIDDGLNFTMFINDKDYDNMKKIIK